MEEYQGSVWHRLDRVPLEPITIGQRRFYPNRGLLAQRTDERGNVLVSARGLETDLVGQAETVQEAIRLFCKEAQEELRVLMDEPIAARESATHAALIPLFNAHPEYEMDDVLGDILQPRVLHELLQKCSEAAGVRFEELRYDIDEDFGTENVTLTIVLPNHLLKDIEDAGKRETRTNRAIRQFVKDDAVASQIVVSFVFSKAQDQVFPSAKENE